MRKARERRQLSLDDIARTTKINVVILQAIDDGDPARLPATIYARGFVKSYAREVGLDPEETANGYFGFVLRESLPVDPGHATHNTTPSVHGTAIAAFDRHNTRSVDQLDGGRFGGLMLAASAVGLIVYIGLFTLRGPSAPAATPNGLAVASAEPTVPEAPPEAPAPEADARLDALEVVLTTDGPCWLSAAADGSRVLAELLQAGELRRIEVRDELVLRVGDPGACAFSINGQAGRSLGPAGAPVNVRITRDNYRDFLSS